MLIKKISRNYTNVLSFLSKDALIVLTNECKAVSVDLPLQYACWNLESIKGEKLSKSISNIFKEIKKDLLAENPLALCVKLFPLLDKYNFRFPVSSLDSVQLPSDFFIDPVRTLPLWFLYYNRRTSTLNVWLVW